MQLLPVQVRVLGCLLEKERTTPDTYPLTMSALLAACNQTTNRWPVLSLNEYTVSSAIENLKGDGLVRVVHSRSNRADRYRHVLDEAWGLTDAELAVLAVLLLRGPQTTAELRTRTERSHPFTSVDDVEAVLAALAARPEPLVVRLLRAPGQKEPRWAHLVAGAVAAEDLPPAAEHQRPGPRGQHAVAGMSDRLESMEAAVAGLRVEVERLRAAHDALAGQFKSLLE